MFVKLVMLFLFIDIAFAAIDDIKIVYSNIDAKQEDHAIAHFLLLLESETDYKIMAKKLVTEMDTKFGKSWFAQIGTNHSSEFYIDQTGTGIITVTFKAIQMTLYRIGAITTAVNTNTSYNASAHILSNINAARNSTFKLIASYGVNATQINATQIMTKIVDNFKRLTNGFSTQYCLRYKENEIGRFSDTNCYAYINAEIMSSSDFDYERWFQLTICENAYCDVNYFTDETIAIEFSLGPLYFVVFQNKCKP